MRRLALSLFAVVAFTPLICAQNPPVQTPAPAPIPSGPARLKSNEYAITVTGCIRGRRLTASTMDTPGSVFEMLRATEFVLQGSRELLRQIQDEHDGHYDQIEGVVSVPPATNGASSTTKSKEFGKTRVTVGGREEGKAYVQDPPKPLALKVTALTHKNDGCAAAR